MIDMLVFCSSVKGGNRNGPSIVVQGSAAFGGRCHALCSSCRVLWFVAYVVGCRLLPWSRCVVVDPLKRRLAGRSEKRRLPTILLNFLFYSLTVLHAKNEGNS
ncbi:unnamed protein product, partial [Hapterophycus canaliculatus]